MLARGHEVTHQHYLMEPNSEAFYLVPIWGHKWMSLVLFLELSVAYFCGSLAISRQVAATASWPDCAL